MDCSESKFSSDRHRKPALLRPGSVSRTYPCWHLCLEEPSSSMVPPGSCGVSAVVRTFPGSLLPGGCALPAEQRGDG